MTKEFHHLFRHYEEMDMMLKNIRTQHELLGADLDRAEFMNRRSYDLAQKAIRPNDA